MVLRADNGLLNVPKCLEMLDEASSMGGIKKVELIKTFLSQPEGRRFALEVTWKHVMYHVLGPVKSVTYRLWKYLLKHLVRRGNTKTTI